MMQKRRCSYGRYDLVRTGGHLYCIFYDHCFLCRNGDLFCLYLAFLCGFMCISCIWKMVLQEKYGPHLVLSGGKGPDEPVSEAQAMYRYLVYNGVRPGQLLLEEHSVSTVENLAYSKLLIESHREMIRHEREERNHLKFSREPKENYLIAADKPLEVGVLTSNFHVYRACMIAKKWGFENVYGISAQSDPVLFIHLCVRECASIIKDRIMGNM